MRQILYVPAINAQKAVEVAEQALLLGDTETYRSMRRAHLAAAPAETVHVVVFAERQAWQTGGRSTTKPSIDYFGGFVLFCFWVLALSVFAVGVVSAVVALVRGVAS